MNLNHFKAKAALLFKPFFDCAFGLKPLKFSKLTKFLMRIELLYHDFVKASGILTLNHLIFTIFLMWNHVFTFQYNIATIGWTFYYIRGLRVLLRIQFFKWFFRNWNFCSWHICQTRNSAAFFCILRGKFQLCVEFQEFAVLSRWWPLLPGFWNFPSQITNTSNIWNQKKSFKICSITVLYPTVNQFEFPINREIAVLFTFFAD